MEETGKKEDDLRKEEQGSPQKDVLADMHKKQKKQAPQTKEKLPPSAGKPGKKSKADLPPGKK